LSAAVHSARYRRGTESSTAEPAARGKLDLTRKYPNASTEWAWQWVFPASDLCLDPRTGIRARFHLHESVLPRSVRAAVREARIGKLVGCHTFRHSFATYLMESGSDIRTVQELLGHVDVRTTMVCTHVLNRGGHGVLSPADRLEGAGDDARALRDRPQLGAFGGAD